MEEYKKKYEEALERARKINNGEGVAAPSDYTICETIFPELKESEEESIKEDIISLINEFWERIGSINPEYSSRSKMLAWLEKQGEHKLNPVFDIEIPFGANDSELQEVSYHIPEGFHAKIESNKVVIKRGEQNHSLSEEDYNEMGVIACHLDNIGNEAMAYSLLCIRDKYDNVKPKQEWSEEDERMLKNILECLKNGWSKLPTDILKYESWLKSLKERMKGE